MSFGFLNDNLTDESLFQSVKMSENRLNYPFNNSSKSQPLEVETTLNKQRI